MELILIPGWGAAAKHLGQGLLAQSHPSFAPSGGRDAASLLGSLRVQGMEILQVWLRCPFCLLLKGSVMDLHLFGWLHPLPHCLHGGAVCAPFVGPGEQVPPAPRAACDSLPHLF